LCEQFSILLKSVWICCQGIFPCTGVHVAASKNPHIVYGCVAVFFHALEFMLLHHRIHIIIKTTSLAGHLCSLPKAARPVIYYFARFKATFNCATRFCFSAAAWAGCTAKPLGCSCLTCHCLAYCCPAAAIGQWILCSQAAAAAAGCSCRLAAAARQPALLGILDLSVICYCNPTNGTEFIFIFFFKFPNMTYRNSA